jgi:putative transposase
MPSLWYSGYRFPPDIIQRAMWMYLRFTLSFRDIEELLAERGIGVTYESTQRRMLTFGPAIARQLRARRPKPHGRWHLDETCVRVVGKQMYLWRAVDAEGEVLDVLPQAKRDTKAARKLMRKLLKKQGVVPNEWVTDKNPAGLWGCSSHPQADPSPAYPVQAGQQPSLSIRPVEVKRLQTVRLP